MHSFVNITMKKLFKNIKIRYDMVDNLTYISCPFYFNFENMQKEYYKPYIRIIEEKLAKCKT